MNKKITETQYEKSKTDKNSFFGELYGQDAFDIRYNIHEILTQTEINEFNVNPDKHINKIYETLKERANNAVNKLELVDDVKNLLLKRWNDKFTASYDSLKTLLNLSRLDTFATQKDQLATHATHSEIKALTHKISRAVMRNTNPEVLGQLQKIHTMIKKEFYNMAETEIQWLLDGAPAARGGFKDAKSFKNFFNKDPTTISPSRLITAIDSISTAIAYRSIEAWWAAPPSQPEEGENGRKMYEKILASFPKKTHVPFLGANTYTLRGLEDIGMNVITEPIVEIAPDDISDASDVEYEAEKRPMEFSEKKQYREKVNQNDNKYSWPAAAQKGNIPVRAHVSGTTPLVLSVINKLYEINSDSWIKIDDNVRTLAGALILPSYERGDFHTIAETTAGLEYYLEARKNNTVTNTHRPKECLELGLCYMARASTDEVKNIIESVSKYILEQTQDLPVLIRPNFTESINILKNSKDPSFIMSLAFQMMQEVIKSTDNLEAKIFNLSELYYVIEKIVSKTTTDNTSKIMCELVMQGIQNSVSQVLGVSKPEEFSKTTLDVLTKIGDKQNISHAVTRHISHILTSKETLQNKIQMLSELLSTVKNSSTLKQESGLLKFLGKTGYTKSYSKAIEEIRNNLLDMLDKAEPKELSKQDFDAVKNIITTHKGRMRLGYTSAEMDDRYKKHESFHKITQQLDLKNRFQQLRTAPKPASAGTCAPPDPPIIAYMQNNSIKTR